MNILYFVILPIATILIAIVAQKVLRSPILVAILAFAIFLLAAFTIVTEDFLVYAIIYTLIAYITAWIVKMVCCLKRKINLDCSSDHCNNNLEEAVAGLEDSIGNLEDNIGDLNTLLSRLLGTNNNCGCNRRLGK